MQHIPRMTGEGEEPAPPAAPAEPRRIMFFSDRAPPRDDDLSIRLHSIARALSWSGHEVIVATRPGVLHAQLGRDPSDRELDTNLDGVRYVHLSAPITAEDLDIRARRAPAHAGQTSLQDIFGRCLEVFRPDLVMTFADAATSVAAQRAAQGEGRPVMHFARGRGGEDGVVPGAEGGRLRTPRKRAASPAVDHAARRAQHVFANSAAQAERLIKQGVPSSRVSVLPNGTRPVVRPLVPAAPDRGDGLHIVLPGPHLAWSGSATAVRVLSEIAAAKGRALRLTIVADMRDRARRAAERPRLDRIARRVHEAGADAFVRVVPCRSRAEIDAVLASADLALFPWRRGAMAHEWPIVEPARALQVHCPVVMTRLASFVALAEEVGPEAAALIDPPSSRRPFGVQLEAVLDRPLRVAPRDLAPTRWHRRAEVVAAAIARLDAHVAIARRHGAERLAAALAREGRAEACEIAASLRTAASNLRVEGRDGLARSLFAAAYRISSTASDARAVFYAASKADDLVGQIQGLAALERAVPDDGLAPDRRALATARVKAGDIKRLEERLARATDPSGPAPPRTGAASGRRLVYVAHATVPWTTVGYATRTHGLAQALVGRGADLVCLTRPGYPADMFAELDEGRIARSHEIDGVVYRHLPAPRRDRCSDYLERSVDALKDELAALAPACVVAASNHQTALPALIAARELGLPFAYEVRGFWEITRLSREPDFDRTLSFQRQVHLEGMTARGADWVFTLTEAMRLELARRGVAPERISLLPNSADAGFFAPRERDRDLAWQIGLPDGVPVIGYIGSFVEYEGLDDLVAAAILLRAQGREFRLILVGSEGPSSFGRTPITDRLLGMAERGGLDDWLIMPGRVPFDTVRDWYSLIDVAPFPRRLSPVTEMVSPLKPLEAMAMAKPVVVSSVAPLREIAGEGSRGLVFRGGDPADLAAKVASCLDRPKDACAMGERARRWVEVTRNWDVIAQQMLVHLDPLMQR